MKIVNQNQYHIPEGIAEISASIKELKDIGVVVPSIPPDSFMQPVQKTDAWLGMKVEYRNPIR